MNYPHVFSGNPLDRGERERRDEEWIKARAYDPASRFLPMRGMEVLVGHDPEYHLGWVDVAELKRVGSDEDRILLGIKDGIAHFTVDLLETGEALDKLGTGAVWHFENPRTAAEQLSGPEAGILAQARAQLNWHSSHRYCSRCGHESEIRRGGQMRRCPQCDAQHFPRTDPVIIMLVHDGDRCLLGQSRGRLSRMNTYSALAGFMDQAETIEEGVAREVMEEAGIEVKNVRYHSSQPWPFPSSLMIGCHAEAATTEIHMDGEEMTDVRWFSRDDVQLALEGKNPDLNVPGRIAIAHHLIKAWANGL